MEENEHRQRHVDLHASLDELIADWLDVTKGSLSRSTIMELIELSHRQTINPEVA